MKTENYMIKDLFILMNIIYPIILITNRDLFDKMEFCEPMVSYVIGNYNVAFIISSVIVMIFHIIKNFIKCIKI